MRDKGNVAMWLRVALEQVCRYGTGRHGTGGQLPVGMAAGRHGALGLVRT